MSLSAQFLGISNGAAGSSLQLLITLPSIMLITTMFLNLSYVSSSEPTHYLCRKEDRACAACTIILSCDAKSSPHLLQCHVGTLKTLRESSLLLNHTFTLIF